MRVLWFVALVIIAALVISLPGPAAEVVGVVFRQCLTIVSMADPGEAPTGYANVWLDSSSGKLTCEDASGNNCMPSGGGGAYQVLWASIPTCDTTTASRLYMVPDSIYNMIFCPADGSDWVYHISGSKVDRPVAADFSAPTNFADSGSPTVEDTALGLHFTDDGASSVYRIKSTALGATYTVSSAVSWDPKMGLSTDTYIMPVIIHKHDCTGSDPAVLTFGIKNTGGATPQFWKGLYTCAGNYSSSATATWFWDTREIHLRIHFRVRETATTRYYEVCLGEGCYLTSYVGWAAVFSEAAATSFVPTRGGWSASGIATHGGNAYVERFTIE